jgi:hypothetical protein
MAWPCCAPLQRLQDEHVERALQEIQAGVVGGLAHGCRESTTMVVECLHLAHGDAARAPVAATRGPSESTTLSRVSLPPGTRLGAYEPGALTRRLLAGRWSRDGDRVIFQSSRGNGRETTTLRKRSTAAPRRR